MMFHNVLQVFHDVLLVVHDVLCLVSRAMIGIDASVGRIADNAAGTSDY